MFGLPRMNKKGGIPVISELVNIFVNITPKPILLLLFILLIGVLSSFMMPFVLNTFGYECAESETGALTLYKVPMSNIAKKTSANLADNIVEFFNLPSYQLPEGAFAGGDYTRLPISDECIVEEVINGTTTLGYTSICMDCSEYSGFWRSSNNICLSDGLDYTSPLIRQSWNVLYCVQCEPPEEFYYNHTIFQQEGRYFTIRDGANVTQIEEGSLDSTYVKRLKKLGAVEQEQDSTELVNIKCEAESKPQLYVFNIKLFDKTLWIIILIGGALITFFWQYYLMLL